MLRSVVCLVCLVCSTIGYGQDIDFNHLTVEHGLPSNSVLAITQDATGYMWFATRSGLCRYDGVRINIYKSNSTDSTSISNDTLYALLRDSENAIWIGSEGGLDRYNPRKDAFESFLVNGKTTEAVYCLYEDKKGNLWVGSADGLHLLTDRKKISFRSFYASANGLAGNNIRTIFEDHAGNLWVGTNNGLTKMQWINGDYHYKTFRHEPGKQGTINANYITAIAEDAAHQLWIGTQNDGVNLYEPSTNSFISFTHHNNSPTGLIHNRIRTIISTRSGKLWVGTQEGLSIIDPSTRAIISYQHDAIDKKSLSQNSIYSFFEDANGSVWVGTYHGGVNTVYSSTTHFNTLQNSGSHLSLSNNVVCSIVEDAQQNLWIGTEGGGLNYFNRATGLFMVYKNRLNETSGLGSNLVKVVYLDKDGNPWIGTHGGGLNVFDRSKQTFKRFLYTENDPVTLMSEVLSLLDDHKGRFWVATNSGLKLFRRNKMDVQPLDITTEIRTLPPVQASVLHQDAQQNIWIGALPGLYMIKGNTVKVIDSTSKVNCIHEDAKGNIWLGLHNGGLALFDRRSEKLIRFVDKPDMANINVTSLLDDENGTLWLGTNNGLVKFKPQQKSLQTYTVWDGLAGNEFNVRSCLKDSRGELFFGGFNGITHFFSDKIETNNQVAPIVFTGLKLFNSNVGINDNNKLLKENISFVKELTFTHNQNVFTIEFSLLNFIKSGKNTYAYKLEGFDKTWNTTNIPSATYTNLPSGTYTFWVKGANNDGIWSTPIAVTIKMLPPFWLTWWAYSIYLVAFAAILFLIVRYFFLREFLKKEDALHQVKLNFFTNISHEIRTHLTLIMAPVEQMMDQKEKDGFDYQQLAKVKTNADRLLRLVSELMDFRKAETGHVKLRVARHDLIPFLQDIYTSFRELSLARDIKMSFLHDTEEALLYFDREQLEKVFFNLLTNAFKFTSDGGHIILSVEQKEKQVSIAVKDNGRGIAPQYADKLFMNFFQVADYGIQNTGYGIGLALSKNIVELHRGTITVESEPASNEKEGKTTFTVTLLQGRKHFEGTDHFLYTNEMETKREPRPGMLDPLLIASQAVEENKDKAFTILIVEDNAELRTLIRQTFINQYHVLEGENGLHGWHTATEQIPDLIISDVMMPAMDGFTLCEQLKTDERTSHVPVILLTAKSSQSEQVSGLETGADVYLTKPFSTKVLELNVRNLLASRERMRQKFSQHMTAQPQPNVPTIEIVEGSMVNAVDREFLNKVIKLVEEHMDNPEFGVDMLSRKVALSAPILYKKIKATTNMSVNDFIKSLRLKKAAQLLQQKNQTVYEVAYAVGYNDRKYFSKEFKKQFGKTPSEFISG